MQKKFLNIICSFVTIFSFITFTASSQSNQWTWVKGDNIANQRSIYGTKGVAAASNKPGARYKNVSWTDASGNLWLFGGHGIIASGETVLNDLWKFDVTTTEWTWVKGDNNITDQSGIYGTQGVPNPQNKPGARLGSVSWTDGSRNLWLFGGHGLNASGDYGHLNDLWKFDVITNRWTWVKGDNILDQPDIYGTQGVVAASNKPGARYESVSWTDPSGNLWLFGGLNNTAGILNDLWKFDVTTTQWTWVKGDKNTVPDRSGIYGTQGVAAPSNKPGARKGSVSWTDASGNLWLFGGNNSQFGYNYLNDLWKFDVASAQ